MMTTRVPRFRTAVEVIVVQRAEIATLHGKLLAQATRSADVA